MNFDFNDEQHMFQETFNDFLRNEYPLDAFRTRAWEPGIDRALWEGLSELGLFSLLVPEDLGGLGLDFVDLALVLEELGKALVPPPVVETLVCTDLIARAGTPEQQSAVLPQLVGGELVVVPAVQEPGAGFDPARIDTALTAQARKLRLNGRKILVPHAASADFIVVTARDDAGGGPVTVLVDRARAGITLSAHSTLDDSCQFQALSLEDVQIEEADIIGDRASGATVARLFDLCGTVAALQMIGVAKQMLDHAVEYAKQRVQFDKPIGSFQAIKHKCADMAMAIEAGTSAAYYAAWAVAEDVDDRSRAVSVAKSFCGDAASQACRDGIQVHGGMGFTWELGLHYYLRRTKVLQQAYGDAAFHRERVMADTLSRLSA